MPLHDDLRSTAAMRIIAHILADIVDDTPPVPIVTAGLPADAVVIPDARLIVAATPLDPPMLDGCALRAAGLGTRDVMLLHIGLHPEVLNSITVYLVTTSFGVPCGEADMVLCRMLDGRLLVAPQRGRSAYAVTADGLVELDNAFVDADERSDAACRFAKEIVHLSQR